MRLYNYIVPGIMVLVMTSCDKETVTGTVGRELKVAEFALMHSERTEFRSTINSSATATTTPWPVSWEKGDRIYYYTMRNTTISESAKDKQFAVNVDADKVAVPVTYSDGDNAVIFCTKGQSIGTLGSKASTTFVLTDGVPSSQNGTFADQYVGVAKAGLLDRANTTPNVTISPVQSFIKFKMSGTTFGDEVVDRIVVKGGVGTEKVCGNTTVTATGTIGVALSGSGGTSITIDKTASAFYADTDYYVAVLPGSYASGLTFQLFHGKTSTTPLAELYVKNGAVTLTAGKVLDIGILNDHKSVLWKFSEDAMPSYAAITKDMTKKFWVYVEPSDFNGTLEVTAATTGGTYPAVSIENTGAKETLSDGRTYMMFKVSPSVSAYTDYDDMPITVKVKNPDGTVKATSTVKLNVGNFVDMGTTASNGHKVLWARSNLSGSYKPGDNTATSGSTTSTLALENDNLSLTKGMYMWGWINNSVDGSYSETETGNGNGSKYITRFGSTYYSASVLENIHDVAYQWNHSCRCPYTGEVLSMAYFSYTTNEDVTGHGYLVGLIKKRSAVLGYTDVEMTFKRHQVISSYMLSKEGMNGTTRDAVYLEWTTDGFGVPGGVGNSYKSQVRICYPVKELSF